MSTVLGILCLVAFLATLLLAFWFFNRPVGSKKIAQPEVHNFDSNTRPSEGDIKAFREREARIIEIHTYGGHSG